MALDISWAIAARDHIEYIELQTELDEVVYPEAYPYIENFDSYIEAYLDHKAPVLILNGSPGTGKTRLIRYILKIIGIRKF
jgi:Cdc6-like AAA superfamily ATPase